MRLAHLSDLHLGFRQYDRTTAGGINQREADVARSFDAAIAQTIALAPELVVIGGDVFHSVRPPNRAIVHAYAAFRRVRDALPHAPIVMVAGNHDTPREASTGSILRLFTSLGIHVIDGAAQTLDFPALNCCVLAVADNQFTRPALSPSSSRRFNVLLLHGETGGISVKGSPAAEREISDDEMHHDAWDYVALGHYHVYRQVGPRAYYSGAIDYTSSNVWGEHAEERTAGLDGKGIVERDLATGTQTFHPLPRSRRFVDLEPIAARGLSVADVNAAIESRIAALGQIDGTAIRLVAHDLDRLVARELDHAMLRGIRRRALNFQLVVKKPEPARLAGAPVHAAVRRGARLEEIVGEMLRDRELPSDLDRGEFAALGAHYLDEATKVEARRIEVKGVPKAAIALAESLSGMPDPYLEGEVDALPAQLREQLTPLTGVA